MAGPKVTSSSNNASEQGQRLPRLVKRNLTYHQSRNRLHISGNKSKNAIFHLKKHDWFHVLLRQPTWISLTYLITIWTAMIIFFAGLYVAVDQYNPEVRCGLGAEGTPILFGPAFAFSLETCTTVGYGLPNGVNSFFENDCGLLKFVIYLQMVWSMFFNAFLFAFFYSRLGRSETRGTQVIMSDKAIVNMSTSGQVRFQLRVFDVDARHPVVEAHVRLYAISQKFPVPRILRTVQPNDELGGMLFLSLPSVVTHHIDVYSMLHPPTETPIRAPALDLRQADSATANREEVICTICGESYGTYERWINHVRYQKIVEAKEDYPVESTHLSITEKDLAPPPYPTKNLDELREYFNDSISEIICLVEGIDPLMSGTFQAMQSYTYEDIIWDEDFSYGPCLKIQGGNISVDYDRFHSIERTPHPEMELPGWRSFRHHDSIVDDNNSQPAVAPA